MKTKGKPKIVWIEADEEFVGLIENMILNKVELFGIFKIHAHVWYLNREAK